MIPVSDGPPPFQPAEPVEIYEKQQGGGGPGHGIAENYGFNGWLKGNSHNNPDHPESADAQADQQHGNPAVAYSPEGAGVNLNEDIGKEGRNQITEYFRSFLDYCLIGGKQQVNVISKGIKEGA